MVAPYAAPGGGTLSSSMRYQLEVQFAIEAQGWLQTHPDALPLFQRLMAPELSSVLNAQASVGAA